MKGLMVCLMVLFVAGVQTGCDKPGGNSAASQMRVDDIVAEAGKSGIPLSADAVLKALAKDGCNIVFANGIGTADPHVIVAADTTAANDAEAYYTGLALKDRKAIEDSVYQRAWSSFVCVRTSVAGKACSKDIRVSFGSGHLSRLRKDVYIVQSERSCQCN